MLGGSSSVGGFGGDHRFRDRCAVICGMQRSPLRAMPCKHVIRWNVMCAEPICETPLRRPGGTGACGQMGPQPPPV